MATGDSSSAPGGLRMTSLVTLNEVKSLELVIGED